MPAALSSARRRLSRLSFSLRASAMYRLRWRLPTSASTCRISSSGSTTCALVMGGSSYLSAHTIAHSSCVLHQSVCLSDSGHNRRPDSHFELADDAPRLSTYLTYKKLG